MGRESNGGHSTKAKGVDKRKNQYRTAIAQAISYDDLTKLLKNTLLVALDDDSKDRMKATQMLFEYTLGKPKESVEIDATVDNGIDFKDLINSIRANK